MAAKHSKEDAVGIAKARLQGLEPVWVVSRSDGMHLETYSSDTWRGPFPREINRWFNFKYPGAGTAFPARVEAEEAFLSLIEDNHPSLNHYDYDIVVVGKAKE